MILYLSYVILFKRYSSEIKTNVKKVIIVKLQKYGIKSSNLTYASYCSLVYAKHKLIIK